MLEIKLLNQSVNFKSGLTNKILAQEKSINIDSQEKIFADRFGIETQFLNNKSSAVSNCLCLKIFKQLSQKLNILQTLPPVIFTYNKLDLIDKNLSANFCIPDTKVVLNGDYPFPGRSIFFRNFKNLEQINANTEQQFCSNISSSSHFLAPFIHEWLHSFHLDYIYNTFGYGGDCEYLKEVYPDKKGKITGVEILKNLETKTLTPKENEIVYETLGYYSTLPQNQYLEIFSETLSKCICESLKDGILVKNPIEKLKTLNPDFQKIFQKVCFLK